MATSDDAVRIAFVGGGAMADALVGGLRASGVAPERIAVAEPDPARRKALEERHRIPTHADNADAVTGADVVVIAVKPNVVAAALTGIPVEAAQPVGLWVSIAAGVTLARLEGSLPSGARVVRAMPNTPSLVHAGATAICGNDAAGAEELRRARRLFEAVGSVWEAPAEGHLDAVTGLSGSGPAYVFLVLEALADAGVRVGLPREAAYELGVQTVYGAAKLALESGQHPGALKDQVTSPGGTTIAGLERLEAGGVRAAIYDAVETATRRSRELGEG